MNFLQNPLFWIAAIAVLFVVARWLDSIFGIESRWRGKSAHRESYWAHFGPNASYLISVSFATAAALLALHGLSDFEFSRGTAWYVLLLAISGIALVFGLLVTASYLAYAVDDLWASIQADRQAEGAPPEATPAPAPVPVVSKFRNFETSTPKEAS